MKKYSFEILITLFVFFAIFFQRERGGSLIYDLSVTLFLVSVFAFWLFLFAISRIRFVTLISSLYSSIKDLFQDTFFQKNIWGKIFLSIFFSPFIVLLESIVEFFSMIPFRANTSEQSLTQLGFPFQFYAIDSKTINVLNLFLNIVLYSIVVFLVGHLPKKSRSKK